MKIRNDFVTNSSSSSFILGFTSEDKIDEELKNGFPNWALEKIGEVMQDVSDAERFDSEEVIERIKDEMKWTAAYYVEEKYRRRTGCSYFESHGYSNTEQGKIEVEKCINDIINKALVKMDGKSVFVEVSYSDNDGEYYSELEHYIMPNVDSTIIRFNHH